MRFVIAFFGFFYVIWGNVGGKNDG